MTPEIDEWPNKEKTAERTSVLAQELGVPADAVQIIRLEDWAREDESFDRETRRLVQIAKAWSKR